jgi:Gluconate 2-dehydrogenase subunit 3
MTKWSRRRFMEAGVFISAVAGTKPASSYVRVIQKVQNQGLQTPLLNAHRQSLLRSVMDELIPARTPMPSASEAGGLAYIEDLLRSDSRLGGKLFEALDRLEALTSERSQTPFLLLSQFERVVVLSEFEQRRQEHFDFLRDTVYETYYERPEIWKLLRYRFYPTDHAGPVVKSFDPTILGDLPQRPRSYREVQNG